MPSIKSIKGKNIVSKKPIKGKLDFDNESDTESEHSFASSDNSDSESDTIVKDTKGKKTKSAPKTLDTESESDSESDTNVKDTKGKKTKSPLKTLDTDSDADTIVKDANTIVKDTKVKKTQSTPKVLDNDSDEDPNISESDNDSSYEDTSENIKLIKKVKSIEDLVLRLLEIDFEFAKDCEPTLVKNKKEILDFQNKHEKKQNGLVREMKSIHKILFKTHTSEVSKAIKAKKTKRKGSSNNGFNKLAPVPPILAKYLELEPDDQISRPQIMSRLNCKFKELGLKTGQLTILDKKAVKDLELDNSYIKKVIKFGELQTFIKDNFYTPMLNISTAS